MTQKLVCLTLDLEPDFLSVDSHEVLLNYEYFRLIESFILQNKLKITTFIVAKMLEQELPIIEKFSKIQNDFELHSYSHNLIEPDSEREIVLGKEIFTKYFGYPPKGYRAPNGAISPEGLSVLERENFLYSASVFPSWRPELGYNFSKFPVTPWKYNQFPNLVELPFAVVLHIRAVISMSFLKLFGIRFFKTMYYLFGFPEILIIDSHLYDFFTTSPVLGLSRFDWRRYALLRNQKKSLQLLQKLITFLKSEGYSFVSMQDIYEIIIHSQENLAFVDAAQLTIGKKRP